MARVATVEDLDLVAAVCAAGFADDPLMCWVFQDVATRADGLRLAFTGLAHGYLQDGSSVVHVVEDACVALWRPPGWHAPAEDEEEEEDGDRESPFAPDVQERFRILGEAMMAAHPTEHHWYLNVLSTEPGRQGQGLGARTLAPTLARCDAERVPAYLESSNPRNMTLYRRHGFEDHGDPIDLPDGPSLYPMWREPR